MKIIGVITEFNPFHKGHQYLFDTLRQKHQADYIIVIMSGDYVQRGIPAIYDKFTRTKLALKGGADLVIEMPVMHCLSSAQRFAASGVTLLHSTNIVTDLAFGMEQEESIDSYHTLLKNTAKILIEEPITYRESLKHHVKQGFSYPNARSKAWNEYAAESGAPLKENPLLKTPNNILALSYVEALLRLNSTMNFITIKRKGSISAHKIREEMLQTKQAGIFTNDFSALLQYALIHYTTDFQNSSYVNIPDFTNEMWNRLQKIPFGASFEEITTALKTKQYTKSRIQRCLFQFMLQTYEFDTKKYDLFHTSKMSDEQKTFFAPYLRILGFKKESSILLKLLKKHASVPVIQKYNKDKNLLHGLPEKLLLLDQRAHDHYAYIANQKYPTTWNIPSEKDSHLILL